MREKAFRLLAVGALLICGAVAYGQTKGNTDLSDAALAVTEDYPGVQVMTENGRRTAFYGKPMAFAETPEAAAEIWLSDYATDFGVVNLELNLVRSQTVGPEARFTVFAYDQSMDGLPVEFGMARIVVLNGSPNAVVLASARLIGNPADGFPPVTVSAEDALQAIQDTNAALTEWTDPALVVYGGEGQLQMGQPIQAWKFHGSNLLIGDNFERWCFFVNASTGELVFARDEVYHTDITGHVHGMATPWGPPNGTYPDDAQNPPADFALEDVQVVIEGVSSTNADDNGDFVLPYENDTEVLVESDLIGPWVVVYAYGVPELHLETLVTPPGPVDFFFNPEPAEKTTSQVNAMIHATGTHDFFKDRQPQWTGIDSAIGAYVNVQGSCNAYYSFNTINFYKKGGGCPNAAYSTVIAHEYGHFIVEKLGLNQGSFGEGVGDTVSILQFDDPMIGRDFLAEGQVLRDTIQANKQYPCTDEIHECGMVLSGVWWDTCINMDPTWGHEEALAYLQQLFTDYMMITIGGTGNDGATPTTAVEVLTVDDDDGDLDNGTPNFDEICSAFAKHNILCPGVTVVNIEYPNGVPDQIPCDTETPFCVRITAGDFGEPDPSTALLTYKILGSPGDKAEVSLIDLGDGYFQALLPAETEGSIIAFYVEVTTTSGTTVKDPVGAPQEHYEAESVCGAPMPPDCPTAPTCEGDANGDNVVDPLDSGYVLARFGCTVGTGDPDCDAADQNLDGVVDPLDVGYVLSRFGPCE